MAKALPLDGTRDAGKAATAKDESRRMLLESSPTAKEDFSDLQQLVGVAKTVSATPKSVLNMLASHASAAFEIKRETGATLAESFVQTSSIFRWLLMSDKISGAFSLIEKGLRVGVLNEEMVIEVIKNPQILTQLVAGSPAPKQK